MPAKLPPISAKVNIRRVLTASWVQGSDAEELVARALQEVMAKRGKAVSISGCLRLLRRQRSN